MESSKRLRSIALLIAISFTFALVYVNCSSSHSSGGSDEPPNPNPDPPPLAADIEVGSHVDGLTVNKVRVSIAECGLVAPSTQVCTWSLMYDQALCGTSACDSLVIYFSGGEMDCETFPDITVGYGKIMASYAKSKYITARACTFDTGQEGFHTQTAQRVDLIIKNITATLKKMNLWNGKNLLLSGISTGATNTPVAMARTHYDDNPYWKGSQKTGICMVDGNFNPAEALDAFTSFSQPSACKIPHDAYCTRAGLPSGCTSSDLTGTGAEDDKIVDVAAEEYSVRDWKIVECGSNLPLCGFGTAYYGFGVDWNKKTSMEQVCTKINDGVNHSCVFGSLPNQGHSDCSWSDQGISACKTWFDGL
jgi:hypothetical protein